jgi:hypothetical protein
MKSINDAICFFKGDNGNLWDSTCEEMQKGKCRGRRRKLEMGKVKIEREGKLEGEQAHQICKKKYKEHPNA